ncbi:response regulator transcription factor [Streptomyces sp. NPDC052109]|uniref:response regulator transcription factor n=1 Tax=Streptomyces sp. NPDC052109 TaxID=3155527 RepID=UPI003437997A
MGDATGAVDAAAAVRVAIVDDHPVTRVGIETLLGAARSVDVVCAVAHPAELPSSDVPLDVVLLDLYLEGDTPGLPFVAQLAERTRVLVMSASRRPGDVLGAIRAGAGGYLTKHCEPELMVSALRTVAAGGFALSPQLAGLLQTDLAEVQAAEEADASCGALTGIPALADRPRPSLAPREEEALRWIARGFTHAQTATRMGVSKATVNTYVERIRRKLQVGNKADLTRAALRTLGEDAL